MVGWDMSAVTIGSEEGIGCASLLEVRELGEDKGREFPDSVLDLHFGRVLAWEIWAW